MDNIHFLEILIKQKEDYKNNLLEELYNQSKDPQSLIDELNNNKVLREIANTTLQIWRVVQLSKTKRIFN